MDEESLQQIHKIIRKAFYSNISVDFIVMLIVKLVVKHFISKWIPLNLRGHICIGFRFQSWCQLTGAWHILKDA